MHLVFIDPGAILRCGESLYLPERSYLGYKAYKDYLAKILPEAEFTVVALHGIESVSGEEVSNLYSFNPSDINLVEGSARTYLQKIESGAVVSSLYKKETRFLVDLPHKIVYLVEVTPGIRRDIILAGMPDGIIARARINFSLFLKDIIDRKIIGKAAGLQTNGPAATARYGGLVSNSLSFYDHRVSAIFSRKVKEISEPQVFNVGFSGRLHPIKGSRYIACISRGLYEINKQIKFFIMGDGLEVAEILNQSAENIMYKGFLDYTDEWVPFVQENIDVMIFPHLQGDPSMTYFESLGQGIPILAFANETANFLESQGLGWTVPKGDVQALVKKIDYLSKNRHEVQAKAESALKFMDEHLYGKTVARRINHLISVGREG